MDLPSAPPGKEASDGRFSVVAVKTSITEYNRFRHNNIVNSASESETSIDDSKMHFATASLFATILEDVILRLNIIDLCNYKLRVKMAEQHMDSLLANKYGVKPLDEPEDFFKYPLNCDENTLEKMTNDRKLCLDVLKKLYLEICLDRTFTQFQQFLSERTLQEDRLFVKEVNERKLHCQQLKHRIRSQRQVQKSAIYDADEVISKLQDQIGDIGVRGAIEGRYMVNWKNALTEQHAQIIHETEDQHMNNIRRYKKEQDMEIRAHDEVERYNRIVIEETKKKVEVIMEKYEKDIETFDLKIQLAMSRLSEVQQKRKDLEKTLACRQKEINEWTKFTKARAAKQALAKRNNDAAVTVQAWWRGLLVRKQLGPFRPKKSKPAQKGKGRRSS